MNSYSQALQLMVNNGKECVWKKSPEQLEESATYVTQTYNENFHCVCICIYNLEVSGGYPIKIHCEYVPSALIPGLKLSSCLPSAPLIFFFKADVSLSFFLEIFKLLCIHNSTYSYHILLKTPVLIY